MTRIDARVTFVALWVFLLLLKTAVAARLPLFVDEAFYWQESRHLAWAYSDLPGLTAWLIRIGNTLFGDGVLAVRLPFLVIAALLPWLVVRIALREFDARHAWLAGIATMLLPLAGTLGVLALPDAAMALATLLCVDAGARMLRKVSYGAALQLAIGLAIGALSHYRFAAVIGVGLVALLLLPAGRQALRDPRIWIAIAFGAAAWTPLLAWNFDNADAGLRFQLVDRHPWSWQPQGLWFVVIQALLVTPLLFVALLAAGLRAQRLGGDNLRMLSWLGLLVLLGFFALGFFADTERVSFHWPLPGYLALLPLLPALLDAWPRWLRRATWVLAACGLAAVLGYYVLVSMPTLRAQTAALKWYPSNFAGWEPLAQAVREVRAKMPRDTRIVADNFKIGAELGFALGNPDIPVLDHALNRAHGRAPQLQLWNLDATVPSTRDKRPVLLVVGATDVKFSELLMRYQQLCEWMGPLPAPKVINVDHGAQRFLLFRLLRTERDEPCTTPALAHIDSPGVRETVPSRFDVTGWAIKDHAGIAGVTITLDGKPVAKATYGSRNEWVAGFWKGRSKDPHAPRVGFTGRVDASDFEPGHHWLGLVLHGTDGSTETWAERPIVLSR